MNAFSLGVQIMKERLTAGRMMVIWPLLAMFILFSSWGLSDENGQFHLPDIDRFRLRCDVRFNSIHYFLCNSWCRLGLF